MLGVTFPSCFSKYKMLSGQNVFLLTHIICLTEKETIDKTASWPGGTTCPSLGMFTKACSSFLSRSKQGQGQGCSGTLRWVACSPSNQELLTCDLAHRILQVRKPGPQEDQRQTLSKGVHREPGCEPALLAPAHPPRGLPEDSWGCPLALPWSPLPPASASPSRAASPTTMSVAVLTAWPSVFSATALYWPPSVAETLG